MTSSAVIRSSSETEKEQKPNEESKDIRFNAFKFSRKFFTNGIKTQITNFKFGDLLNSDLDEGTYFKKSKEIVDKINPVLKSMSEIYKDITTFPVVETAVTKNTCKDGILRILKDSTKLGKHVIDIVKSHYLDEKASSDNNDEDASSDDNGEKAISGDKDKYILFMQGPVGSYKNRLLQYVYLSLCGEFAKDGSKQAPVFYIDFSKYESGQDFNIQDDINTINYIIGSNQVPPLFILDNVRGFGFGNIWDNYSKFRDNIIVCKTCKLIVSMDVDFNRNSQRCFLQMPFGCIKNYKNQISITSISVNKKKYCKDFINACVNYFKETGDIGQNVSVPESNSFYGSLVKMEETNIDAYQIKLIIDAIIDVNSQQRNDLNIATIYSYILESIAKKDEVYKMAYEYEYTDKDCITNIPEWCKIIEHRSTLDYCIAQYYVQQLKTDINNKQQSFNVPNAIFYKGINRFIVPQVKSLDCGVVSHIKKRYNEYREDKGQEKWDTIVQRTPELSQLFYILGKYDNREYSERVKSLLQTIEQELSQSENQNLRIRFLLRTIYVSLIWRGDQTAAFKYFQKLILEEVATLSDAAKINIGFHLVYYDDTKVGFGENSMPDYTDIDVKRCLNTLCKLLTEIDCKMRNGNMDLIGVLHLITACHILQVNIKNISKGKENRFKEYEIKAIDPEGKFLQQCRELCKEFSNIKNFEQEKTIKDFCQSADKNMTNALLAISKRFFDKYLTNGEYIKNFKNNVAIYNKYSRLNEIPRTGWINRGIKEGFECGIKEGFEQREEGKYYKKYNVPENVAEHTLNCWLLGYIFLPKDKYKQTVLDLLLVHDFAEIQVGDIIKNKKNKNDIEQREQDEMGNFLNGLKSEELLENWKKVWVTDYEEGDAQYIQVAYDIDKIQAMYQYFSYYAADVIEKKDVNMWLYEYDKLRTDIGRGIAKVVVFLNEKFHQNEDLCILFYDKYKKIEKNEQSSKTDAGS